MELSNEFITVRTLTILKALNVTTFEELKKLTLPEVGKIIKYLPLAGVKLVYTQKADEEIKDYLLTNVSLTDLQRYGNPLIKYPLNVIGNHHLMCYEYKGVYFQFYLFGGRLVDDNERFLKHEIINGQFNKGKYFNEYFNSSLNAYHTDKMNKPFIIGR